jgi:hypothetical protein
MRFTPKAVGVEVGVTPEAADYISQRGGRIYLWQGTVGAAWAADHMSFDDPGDGITFTPVWVAGVAVMLADDLDRPKSLRVRIDRFPHRLHVEWDGVRWGWRGSADHEG